MANVEDLYKCYAILDSAGANIDKHGDVYSKMLQGVKGNAGARKLSAGFIVKFFPKFANLSEKAVEALIDLCEDEDLSIRKLAIQHLPDLYRDGGDNSPLGDILSQLLVTEDASELRIVKKSLETLLRKDPCAALAGLFLQINNNDESCREKSLLFLSGNVVALAPTLIKDNVPVERYTLDEIKKTFLTVTSNEFPHFMKLLGCLSLAATPEGAQEVVDTMAGVACLDETFQADDSEAVDRLLVCTRNILPSVRRGASPWMFLEYLINNAPTFGDVASEESRLELYGWLASLSCSPPTARNSQAVLDILLDTVLTLLPPLPAEATGVAAGDGTPKTDVGFVVLERLLYTLHQLAMQCPEQLTQDAAGQAKLLYLRQRLQVLGMKAGPEERSLKATLQGKAGSRIRLEPALKSQQMALQACHNISVIVKVFFKNPPVYKADLLPASIGKENLIHTPTPVVAGKRPSSTSGSEHPAKRSAPPQQPRGPYQPPVGKFSKGISTNATTAAASQPSGFSLSDPSNPLMRGENVASAPGHGGFNSRGRGGRGASLTGRGRGVSATQRGGFQNGNKSSWRAPVQNQSQQVSAKPRRQWRQRAAVVAASTSAQRGAGRKKLVRNRLTWQKPQVKSPAVLQRHPKKLRPSQSAPALSWQVGANQFAAAVSSFRGNAGSRGRGRGSARGLGRGKKNTDREVFVGGQRKRLRRSL